MRKLVLALGPCLTFGAILLPRSDFKPEAPPQKSVLLQEVEHPLADLWRSGHADGAALRPFVSQKAPLIAVTVESAVENFRKGLASIVFGVIIVFMAITIQYFNEERSARVDTLLQRGLQECRSVDAEEPKIDNRGCLVHVQGRTCGALPVADHQFQDATVKRCLKFQSTVEVFEWVQTTRTWLDGKERRTQPRFHTEWSTVHHDSLRFRKPSPENPRLPVGLQLGTFTKCCPRVELGSFILPEDMIKAFHKLEPAIEHLPPKLTAHGIAFVACLEDGYYYARPGLATTPAINGKPDIFRHHLVGDIRVRFLHVPEGDATVVAVQCETREVYPGYGGKAGLFKDAGVGCVGAETFVPFRPIPRPPCLTAEQERLNLIEEGDRPLKDLRHELSCCSGGVASCCCCACNVIACFCKEEIVTEEIMYVADRLDPVEKAFETVVPRSPCRVWNFRVAGWAVMYLGIALIIGPFSSQVNSVPCLLAYGGAAPFVLAMIITVAFFSLIVAAAYVCYRPVVSLRWMCVFAFVLIAPLAGGAGGRSR